MGARGWCIALALTFEAVSHTARAQEPDPAAQAEEFVPEEVTIRAPPVRATPAATLIRAEEARKAPGTLGDAAKAIQNLPSVGRAAFGGGALVVWGSAPADTRVFIDGTEVPNLYHAGGVRSVIPSALVRSIELLAGGFGAEHGRALGGIALIDTESLPESGVHGFLAVDVFDAAAGLQVAASDELRIGLAARYSYLDKLAEAVVGPEVGDFYPLPRYHDGQLKLTAPLGAGRELSATFTHAGDSIDRSLPSSDPAKRRTEKTLAVSERVALRYRAATERETTLALASFGYDRDRSEQAFGSEPTLEDATQIRYGLRAEHSRVLVARQAGASSWSPAVSVRFGVDALGTRTGIERRGTLTLPAREGDVFVFGQPPSDELAADNWSTDIVDVAPYVSGELEVGPFTLVPGVRFNGTLIDVSRKTPRVGLTPGVSSARFEPSLDPRVALRVKVGERLGYAIAAGLYHQPPDARDLSAVFGTPTLTPAEATHLTIGQNAQLYERLSLELVGFHKTFRDLVARSRRTLPALATALTNLGEGESFGANLLLRQGPVYGFSGWLSYAISRAERSRAGESKPRLFDFDQTHVLGVAANQSVAGFDFGARFRVSSGMPRTPVVGAYYNAKDDRYEPVFGDHGSIRLPLFYQLDLRAEHTFELGPTKLGIFIDVQNVTNARNPEELAYTYDFGARSDITGLPVFGTLGVTLEI